MFDEAACITEALPMLIKEAHYYMASGKNIKNFAIKFCQ